MKRNIFLQLVVLLTIAATGVQARENVTVLRSIGEHAVHRPTLQTKKELWQMMRSRKYWGDMKRALNKARCPGTKTGKCSDLISDIYALFPADYNTFRAEKASEIRDRLYKPNSIIFHWMMFRKKGVGKVKASGAVKWGGLYALPAYEFSIPYKNDMYVFTIPKECGNLALVWQYCLE